MNWKKFKPNKSQYARFTGQMSCLGCLYYLKYVLNIKCWPHLIIVFFFFCIVYICALYEGK